MEVRTHVGDISSLDKNIALEMLLKLKEDFIEIRELSDSISNDIRSLTLAGAKINKKKEEVVKHKEEVTGGGVKGS